MDNYCLADIIYEDYHDALKAWWKIRRKKHLTQLVPAYDCLLDFMEGSQWTVESVLATMKKEIQEFKNEEVQEILDIL